MSEMNPCKAMKEPTPAQLNWLRQIKEREVTRLGWSWVNGLRCYGGLPSKSTYVMTLALRDAGWIDAVPGSSRDRFRIVLTPSGQVALSKSAPKGEESKNG